MTERLLAKTLPEETKEIRFDLGTFEGFNFRSQSAIFGNLTAAEVVGWDHDKKGEAEFWPSGDHAGVRLVFKGKSSVTYSQILALDRLLQELGDDSNENFLRIYYAVYTLGIDIIKLSREAIGDQSIRIFSGDSFIYLRRAAAFQLFELYYEDEYLIWEKSTCDGLIFDPDRFLDSPGWSIDEIELGELKFLIIADN